MRIFLSLLCGLTSGALIILVFWVGGMEFERGAGQANALGGSIFTAISVAGLAFFSLKGMAKE
jgi:hypothetical protein